jgi:cyanate permease
VVRADAPALEGPAQRWVVFGAMCAVYFAFGIILQAIPPMVAEVRADLDVSRGMLGFALGAWSLIYIVTAPPAGQVIDRIGLRWSLAVGSLLVAVSAALQSMAQGIGMLWIAIGVIGIGGPLVSLAAPKLVAISFPDGPERALAIGFYTSAPAVGGVLALLLTHSVLLPLFGDWRNVLLFEAALNVVAAVAWVLVSGRAPERASSGTGVAELPPPSAGMVARALLGSSGFRLAVSLGVGTFFITQGVSAWLPNMLEEHSGLSPEAAAAWAAGSMAVGISARLVMPGAARPERRSFILLTVMVALAMAMVTMAVGPTATDAVAALVLGLRSALTSLVILVLMEADHVTSANVALAYGMWLSAGQVGGALGPQVVGMVGDSRLGFPGALIGMAGMLVVMMAVLFRDDRRHPTASTPATLRVEA